MIPVAYSWCPFCTVSGWPNNPETVSPKVGSTLGVCSACSAQHPHDVKDWWDRVDLFVTRNRIREQMQGGGRFG